jgi:hypothetical protein
MSNNTNKEKAKELFYNFCKEKSCDGRVICTFCPRAKALAPLIEMAEWKEKQMIERAQDFIATWFYEHPHEQKFICSDEFGSIDQLLEKLKKAMEE